MFRVVCALTFTAVILSGTTTIGSAAHSKSRYHPRPEVVAQDVSRVHAQRGW
jgi:hypothetical protein